MPIEILRQGSVHFLVHAGLKSSEKNWELEKDWGWNYQKSGIPSTNSQCKNAKKNQTIPFPQSLFWRPNADKEPDNVGLEIAFHMAGDHCLLKILRTVKSVHVVNFVSMSLHSRIVAGNNNKKPFFFLEKKALAEPGLKCLEDILSQRRLQEQKELSISRPLLLSQLVSPTQAPVDLQLRKTLVSCRLRDYKALSLLSLLGWDSRVGGGAWIPNNRSFCPYFRISSRH